MILVSLGVVVCGMNDIWGRALAMEGGVGASPSSQLVGDVMRGTTKSQA